MTGFIIKGNWNQIKGRLKQRYGNLTDDDLLFIEGKEDELIGKLQEKLGKGKEEIERLLSDLSDPNDDRYHDDKE